jgi:hypothetical protein
MIFAVCGPTYDANEFPGWSQQRGWVIKDNIMRWSDLIWGGIVDSPPPLPPLYSYGDIRNYFPDLIAEKNLYIDDRDIYDTGGDDFGFFTQHPDNLLIENFSDVGFVNVVTSTSLVDPRLDPSSPYAAGNANDASDGKDLGADIPALIAAMGFNPFTGELGSGAGAKFKCDEFSIVLASTPQLVWTFDADDATDTSGNSLHGTIEGSPGYEDTPVPAASFQKFQAFVEQLAEKVHNLGADTLTLFLTAAANAPVAGNSQLSHLTQIAYTNFGSRNITITSSAQASGVYKLILTDLVLTTSGAVATFRYAGIYNNTAVNDELICFFDCGADLSLASGQSAIFDFDGTNGILQLSYS